MTEGDFPGFREAVPNTLSSSVQCPSRRKNSSPVLIFKTAEIILLGHSWGNSRVCGCLVTSRMALEDPWLPAGPVEPSLMTLDRSKGYPGETLEAVLHTILLVVAHHPWPTPDTHTHIRLLYHANCQKALAKFRTASLLL